MTSSVRDVNTPDGIMRLGNAFVGAKVLPTAVGLDLFSFSAFQLQPPKKDPVARGAARSRPARALASHRWVAEKYGDHYREATGADRYLVHGLQMYIGDFLQGADHYHYLYPVWEGSRMRCAPGSVNSAGDAQGRK